jgi:hypothetical protein
MMVVPEIICLVQGYSAVRIAKELPNATAPQRRKKSSVKFFGLKRKRYKQNSIIKNSLLFTQHIGHFVGPSSFRCML